MVLLQVKIVFFIFLYGFSCLDCAIIGSIKQNVHSAIDNHENTDTIHMSPIVDNGERSNSAAKPLKPILPQNAVLKIEQPKIQRKIYHHYTIEEMRQRRKELREKWQARHNLLLHGTPHGLHYNNQEPVKVVPKILEINSRNTEKKTPSSKLIEKNKLLDSTHPKHIADMYEQVTPRTRRILEHKDDTDSFKHLPSIKTKQLFSAKTRSTPPTEPEEIKDSKGITKSSQDSQTSTENLFQPNYVNFPIMPDPQVAPMYYWPSATKAPSFASSAKTDENPKHTTSVTGSTVISESSPSSTLESLTKEEKKLLDEQVAMSRKAQGDIRPFGAGPFADDVLHNFNFNFDFRSSSKNPKDVTSKMRAVAERTTSVPSTPALDDIVSERFEPSAFSEGVYTVKIDTAPFYRNLTFHEKFHAQNPILPYGKSAENSESIDDKSEEHLGSTNVQTDVENEKVVEKIDTKPSTKLNNEHLGHEKIADNIEAVPTSIKSSKNTQKPQTRHGKRSSEHTTGTPEGRAMKIAEESPVHHDWRENLRKAVKERLLELTNNSE